MEPRNVVSECKRLKVLSLFIAGLEKAFSKEGSFNYVVNCAGETRHGMGESIYYEGIVTLSSSCARTAAVCDVERFIEISSGCLASDAEVTSLIFIFLNFIPNQMVRKY